MRRSISSSLFAASASAMLTGCASLPVDADVPTLTSFGGSFMADFSEGDDYGRWRTGDYTVTSVVQKSRYAPESLIFNEDGLTITIDSETDEEGFYTTGEYQTIGRYGDGRFEATLQPAGEPGLVTNFFLYTGMADIEGAGEITIQFAGNDTNVARFSYIRYGQERYTYLHDLPFNAAEEAHTYGFERQGETLLWTIDGVVVHEAPEGAPMTPTEDASLVVNLWAAEPGGSEMAGEVAFEGRRAMRVTCVSFTRPGDDAASCNAAEES